MTLRGIRLTVLFILLASASLPANAQSDLWTKKAVITLNDPFEVPGMLVEPGTYVLKLASSNSERNEIQLLNESESQVFTTFTAIRDRRQKPDADTVLSFFDAVPNGPRPIRTWFSVGDMDGFEFVYPRPRARQIAKSTEDHVLAADSKDGEIIAITSNGTEVSILESVGKSGTKSNSAEPVTREKPRPPPQRARPRR